jgi:hypothetical protein
MSSPSDPRLEAATAALADLCERAGADDILIGMDDVPGADVPLFARLTEARLLRPAEPVHAVICDGCDRACPMPVDVAAETAAVAARAFVVCDKRHDIGRVTVSLDRLRRWTVNIAALPRRPQPQPKEESDPVAWEVDRFRRQISVVNRLTNARRTMPRPRLNSVNDLAFEVLFDNPEKIYTDAELAAAIKKRVITSLHKIPQNLGFKGDLRKAFFEVSANNIRFRRAVTVDQLKHLGIDPAVLK